MLLKISGYRTMHIPPVPNENRLPSEVPVHFGEEPDEILRLGIVRKELKIKRQSAEGWGEAERADRREPVVPVPGFMNRRVPRQGPCAAPDGLKHEACFIKKHEC